MPTMDEAAKQRVKDALLSRARADLASAQDSVQIEHSAAQLDQDSSYAVDDQSQADEAGDLMALYEGVTGQQRSDIERIEHLPVKPTDVVAPGAIVGFGGNRYLVGAVADQFECDGVAYEGISADSPIYAAIQGLHIGDTFTFRGAQHEVDFLA